MDSFDLKRMAFYLKSDLRSFHFGPLAVLRWCWDLRWHVDSLARAGYQAQFLLIRWVDVVSNQEISSFKVNPFFNSGGLPRYLPVNSQTLQRDDRVQYLLGRRQNEWTDGISRWKTVWNDAETCWNTGWSLWEKCGSVLSWPFSWLPKFWDILGIEERCRCRFNWLCAQKLLGTPSYYSGR